MSEQKKELVVVALENGTVIDHIPSDKLFKVVSILGLDKSEKQITIGNNLTSKKSGVKGIIKISDKYFKADEIDKIALVAPNAVLNIIKDYKVVEKQTIGLPEEIHDIIKCVNPKCITNNQPVPTRFEVVDKKNIVVRCHYCESMIGQNEIVIK
ncbi:MAG: aspartate carbamoyltransferase regulatory subunit [Paludibacteraceae bacterium]|nr:aspartate carbamoyltransferase regulatory subunit [Paludibacteraceae bacterium]MBP5136041.1 aspartate carbamoyltransferase regulatory subunit [Paludibacteraceae bacterium]MBP5742320.1 aspartate carbamoyltransferase regulatory subunit [Paludibacteraceae bacterium]